MTACLELLSATFSSNGGDMALNEESSPLTGLSDRERVIAAKFAEGMTYREIGETLFIAPSTVRTHLSAIYRKLDIRSKVALATLLGDHSDAKLPPSLTERLSADESGPPILAVMPVNNLSSGEHWNRFADGMAADLIADFARYPDIAVIARQTMNSYKGRGEDARSIGRELNADYLLEATLQVREQRLRICVQLVDAHTGIDLWTSRYDRSTEDLFAVQDMVTENVVNVLASCCGRLAKLQRDVVRRKPPASLRAYDYYLLGVEQHNLYTRASHAEAVRLLSRAVELDPSLARAWTVLGLAHAVAVINAFTTDPSAAKEKWRSCLERALALDAGDTHARICLAELRALHGDLDATEREYDLALAAAPNDSDTLALLAGGRAFVTGDPRNGYELAKRAIRLNPYVPWYYSMLGRSSFVVGLQRESLAAFTQAPSDSPATLLFQAMAHAMLGETPQATEIADRLAREFPDLSAEGFITSYPVTNPPAVAAIREGARRAGLT
jgi:TolB-like protein/DNA-binding CsgD family transcriptional regulator